MLRRRELATGVVRATVVCGCNNPGSRHPGLSAIVFPSERWPRTRIKRTCGMLPMGFSNSWACAIRAGLDVHPSRSQMTARHRWRSAARRRNARCQLRRAKISAAQKARWAKQRKSAK